MDVVNQPDNGNAASNAEISELFRRIGQGEKNALFDLYNRTGGLLFGLALKILGNRADAGEALISIYTRIWEDPISCNIDYSPLACLVIIARAHALMRLYETRRIYVPAQTAATDGGNKNAFSKEQEDARARFEALAPKQREVLDWAFYSGLGADEIAAKTSIPAGAVKTHVRIGLNRLGKDLEFQKKNPEPTLSEEASTGENEEDAR